MSAPLFLPSFVSTSMHKGEFCYCTGLSPYKLKKLIKQHEKALTKIGYSKYDKVLMPIVVSFLCQKSGLRVDMNRLAECIGYAPDIRR